MALVAANDKGHIRAMRSLQPTPTDEEMRAIRLADLECQGVSKSDWRVAQRAISRKETP